MALPTLTELPQGKRIPGTSFVVDGFKYRNPEFVYFLSHFHQDHYGGITKNWDTGLIYCSPITARLLIHVLDVKREFVRALPMNDVVDLGDGTSVRLMGANHCPGAAVFVFDTPGEKGAIRRFVHCGDFRYSPEMRDWVGWRNDTNAEMIDVEEVLLDTTYCNPRFKFPKQDTVTGAIGKVVFSQFQADKASSDTHTSATLTDNSLWAAASSALPTRRKTLFLVATYTIGKEKTLKSISDACDNLDIYVTPEKKQILQLLELDYMDVFVTEPRASPVHVVSWGKLGEMAPGGWRFIPNWSFAQQYLDWLNSLLTDPSEHYTHITGIVPTGWTWEFQRQHGTSSLFHMQTKPGQEHLSIYEVPYSEHSNFEELREFIGFLKPVRVVPTVFGSSTRPEKLAAYFRDLVDAKKRHELGFRGLFGDAGHRKSIMKDIQPESQGVEQLDEEVITTAKERPHDVAVTVEERDLVTVDELQKTTTTTTATDIVSCPICNIHIEADAINTHLDICLSIPSTKNPSEQENLTITDVPVRSTQPSTKRPAKRSPSLTRASVAPKRRASGPTQTKLSSFFSAPQSQR